MTLTFPVLVGALVSIFVALLGSGGLGAVVVALINKKADLPSHFQAELRRLTADTAALRLEVGGLTAATQMYRDHIDVLEHHIYTGQGPPPPKPPTPPVIYSPNPFTKE